MAGIRWAPKQNAGKSAVLPVRILIHTYAEFAALAVFQACKDLAGERLLFNSMQFS